VTIEGMVCPECRVVFATQHALKSHYARRHGVRPRSGSLTSIRSAASTAADVPVWTEQALGVTRILGQVFGQLRLELGGPRRHASPLIVERLTALLYGGSAHVSDAQWEQTVVPWERDAGAAKHCKVCKTPLKSQQRTHCRLCGGLVCGSCVAGLPLPAAARLLADIATRKLVQADIHSQAEAASKASAIAIAAEARGEFDSDSDSADEAADRVSDAQRRLAIIEANSTAGLPRRTTRLPVCDPCRDMLREIRDSEADWIAFMDARLLDAEFPLPVSTLGRELLASLATLQELGSELCELVNRFYRGEAVTQYDCAVELETRYKSTKSDVHTLKSRLAALKPRQGSHKADEVLVKRLYAAVLAQLKTSIATTPSLPPRDEVSAMRARRNASFLASEPRLEGALGDIDVVFEVYENQRWIPFQGFQPTLWNIRFDPAPWSTVYRHGAAEIRQHSYAHNVFAHNYDREFRRMRSRGFPALNDVTPFAGTEFVPGGPAWQVVLEAEADEDGWSYSRNFDPLFEWSGGFRRMVHFVRRRLWVRPVQFVPDLPHQPLARTQSMGALPVRQSPQQARASTRPTCASDSTAAIGDDVRGQGDRGLSGVGGRRLSRGDDASASPPPQFPDLPIPRSRSASLSSRGSASSDDGDGVEGGREPPRLLSPTASLGQAEGSTLMRAMRKEDVAVCTRCLVTRFGAWSRRYHCHTCGFVVCAACSTGRMYSDVSNAMERCCDACLIAADHARRLEATRLAAGDDAGGRTEIFSIFENQRSDMVRWHRTGPPERLAYTEVEQPTRAYAYIEAIKPPDGYEWVSVDWFVDTRGPVDANGWAYAGAAWDGLGISFSPTYNRLLHHTRRRKLIRRIRRVLWGRALTDLRPADVTLRNASDCCPDLLSRAQARWAVVQADLDHLRQVKHTASGKDVRAAARAALAHARASHRTALRSTRAKARKEFDAAPPGVARELAKKKLIVANLALGLHNDYVRDHFTKHGERRNSDPHDPGRW
jgi:uncharacterized Zn finger protein (UPF0148 family)